MLRALLLSTLLSLSFGCGPTGPGEEPRPSSPLTVSAVVSNARSVPMSFWLNLATVEKDGKWTTLAHSEHPPIAPGESVTFSPVEAEAGAELYLSIRARAEGLFFDQKALHVEAGTTGALRGVLRITDEGLSLQWE